MKKLLLLLVLCSLPAFSQIWFDQVRKGSAIEHQRLEKLSSDLRNALKQGDSIDKIAELAPKEALPRAIFITIGGDKWPGRTYFGTGGNFQTAFRVAVEYLLNSEHVFAKETVKLAQATIEDAQRNKQPIPLEWKERMNNPSDWYWIRLDVVQVSKSLPSFSILRSHIAMTSLCGIAFPPKLGFAFTPEQLTARCLLSSNRTLDSARICNYISETYNWRALKEWMAVSAAEEKSFPISLFEVDTYYADNHGATRLYRGHKLEYQVPEPASCLNLASLNAGKLATIVTPEGKVNKPFPFWYSSADNETERSDARLEAAIALIRLYAATKDENLIKTACSFARPLVARLIPMGNEGKALAVREKEVLAPNSSQVPRNVTTVRTNALLAIALMEMDANKVSYMGATSRPQPAAMAECLAEYLSMQVGNDGIVIDTRFMATGKVQTKDKVYASLEDSALVALALERKYPDKSAKIVEVILEKCEKQPIETLVISPWIVEALRCARRSDMDFVMRALRFSYAAEVSDTAPLYPDMYGAIRSYPGCTFSARRCWAVAQMSRWLRSIDKPALAAERMDNVQPLVVFHTQALIDEASSSILPSPAVYRGFFRDNLDEYSFNLSGQSTQIMALTAFAQEVSAMPRKPKALDIRTVRKATDVHPSILQITPVYTQDDMQNIKSRNLMGTFGNEKSVTGRLKLKK